MKRKIALNLAPVKIPARSDGDAKLVSDPSPQPSQQPAQPQPQSSRPSQHPQSPPTHRRQGSKDSVSHLALYISRQSLDATTERELRAACRLILMNFKPSDHGMEDTDPRLDFGAMNRRAGQQAHQGPVDVKVRMPTGAPVDLKTALEARRLRAEAEAKKNPNAAIPTRTLSSRQRFDDAFADGRGRSASRKYAKNPTRTLSKKSSSGDAASVATASTDAHNNYASTAATSAAVTSGPGSKRMSRQLDPAAIADAQAAEWMRTEREKRGRQVQEPPQRKPSVATRPPSRSRSIRNNIKEYIFPGSTPSHGLSRSHSIEQLRLTNTHASQGGDDTKGSASSNGWRSWGFPLRTNSRASSRPGTSRGGAEEPEQAKKPEVNLNRELPPLPSLDSWKEQVRPAETKEKSAVPGTHIASVMRPQDRQHDRVAATQDPYRRSGSDSLSMQYANAYPQSPTRSIQSPSHSHQRFDSKKNSPAMDKAEINHADRLAPRDEHARQRSDNSASLSPAGKKSSDLNNFSRKISMDVPGGSVSSGGSVQVPHTHKEEQKSRLKKVFSGWMLKKDRKEDWMHSVEKGGVKKGVLVPDSNPNGPVVRY